MRRFQKVIPRVSHHNACRSIQYAILPAFIAAELNCIVQPSSLSERPWSPTRIALAVAGKGACAAVWPVGGAYFGVVGQPKGADLGGFMG